MSGSHLNAFMISCDACGATFGADRQYATAIECRAIAHANGWTFPPKLTKYGKLNKGFVHDVCSACSPTFVAPPKVDA